MNQIVEGYQATSDVLERQIILEKISEVWIDSAKEIPLRKHALAIVDQIDNQTAQLAVGREVKLPSEIIELRQALACLVILDHEPRTRELVRKMMSTIIIWATANKRDTELLLVPILRQISVGELRGIARWYSF